MKRILIASGVVVLLLSAILIWRALHPALTDEQQIAANLDAIAAAAGARDAVTIASYLAPQFTFDDQGQTERKEFQRQLYGGILQYRVVDLTINGVAVKVNGQNASSDGRFLLSLKSEYNSPPELHDGDFQLQWQKIDGEWKIVAIKGKVPQGEG